MAPITTIVHFQIPAENIDQFLSYWRQNQESMEKQPGLIGGTFYRGIDPEGPYQFVNVARWESAEALEASLAAAGEDMAREGVDRNQSFKDLGVKVIQSNFTEELQYGPVG